MTNAEKTLRMQLAHLKGVIYDKINEYEVEAEGAERSITNGTKHWRRFHATDLRKMMVEAEKALSSLQYEEVE
jgi:hypothetical protein